MIGAQALSLAYGETRVVKAVDFQLEAGCLTAIIGANGCGKSTLMRALAGLHSAQEGQALGPAQQPIETRRKQIAYLPQSLPEPSALSVESFALLGADSPTSVQSKWATS